MWHKAQRLLGQRRHRMVHEQARTCAHAGFACCRPRGPALRDRVTPHGGVVPEPLGHPPGARWWLALKPKGRVSRSLCRALNAQRLWTHGACAGPLRRLGCRGARERCYIIGSEANSSFPLGQSADSHSRAPCVTGFSLSLRGRRPRAHRGTTRISLACTMYLGLSLSRSSV